MATAPTQDLLNPPVQVASDGWCKLGYRIESGGRRYCAHQTPKTWQEAKVQCAAEGGALARLETEEEQRALGQEARRQSQIQGHVWLGLQQDEGGGWAWVNGTSLKEAFWHSGEPNNAGGNEHCAHIYTTDGTWNDADCNASLPFLCRLPPLKGAAAPGGFRPLRCAGKLFRAGAESYCYHDLPSPWEDARRQCAQNGGDLATFQDPDVYRALTTGDRAPLRAWRFWLDLSDQKQEGQWLWGDEVPVQAPDWHPGEPNNAGGEHCGELLVDHWNDMPCEVKQGWLCEAP